MGSCVSKKAARAGAAREGKAAAPLPPAKEHALSPVVEEEEEEEVKEVVLSETPAPRQPRSPPEPVKKMQELSSSEEEEACSGSESASVGSVAKEKAMAKAGGGGDEQQEVVKRAVVDAPEKAQRARRTAPPDQESKPKPKPKQQGGAAGNGRARSPSPSSAHRRQQQPPPPAPTRPRREPAVVSSFGCRSGRFSPSAARRAAESAVRRSHSAREADMALPAKRCLSATINGHGNGGALSRRDLGERSGRRSDSPTASKRPSPAPSPVHRQAGSAMRRAAARENLSGTTERSRPRVREVGPDAGRGGDEQPALAGGAAGGVERKKAEEGALGQNPSVAMECFIFL